MSSPTVTVDPASRWRGRFWAIFVGQVFSLVGSAVTQFVLIWWIASTTGSPVTLALAAIADTLPKGLFGPLGGTLADRLPRRWIIVGADAVGAACVLVLMVLFGTGLAQPWHVYGLMFVRSSMQAFQSPALAASIPNLVPADWVGKVAGLSQALGGLMFLVAAPLGALALAALPFHGALMIDVVTAILGIVPLLLFAVPQPRAARGETGGLWAEFRAGVGFVRGHRGLSALYVLLALVVLVAQPILTLAPLVVKDIFAGGPAQVALLQGATGAGALVGGLLAATVLPSRRPVKIMLAFFALACAAFFVTTLLPAGVFGPVVAVWLVASAGFAVGNAKISGMVQTVVPNEMQGRAFSLLTTLMAFVAPVGLALAGWAGEQIGVRGVTAWSGALAALACLLAFAHPALRELERAVTNARPTHEAVGAD